MFVCFSDGQLSFQAKDMTNATNECRKLFSYVMSIAGDCRVMISHVRSENEWEKYREQVQSMTSIDEEIQNVIESRVIDETCKGKNENDEEKKPNVRLCFSIRIRLGLGIDRRDGTKSFRQYQRL